MHANRTADEGDDKSVQLKAARILAAIPSASSGTFPWTNPAQIFRSPMSSFIISNRRRSAFDLPPNLFPSPPPNHRRW